MADEKRVAIIRRAHDAALAYDPRIKMASIDYSDEVRGRTVANSEGLLLEDELPLIFFIVQTLGVGNGTSHMGRERLSRHAGLELFDEVRPEDVARTSARESIAMLEAKDAPAGKMDVVMENGWGGVLVHEAVGHPLEADNIARKTGVFVGKLGQKVASDVFTMVDDGSLPNHRGTTNFDDEGTPMKRNVLIQDGVLLKFMTDILSAKQIGMERTGNGRRESFRYIPIPRMTNTFIDKGRDDPADILASTKSGLYVQSLSGGSVNPTTGVFNFTCREAYLIEDGKKTEPVKGATLIGNCLDIIQGIDAVGDNLAFGPGICGKGQAAEVDAGQPTVRIRGINVGGTRAQELRRKGTKETTMTDYKGLAEQLVRTCLKKGADAAEVYLETGRNLNIDVRNGEIETIQEASGAGAGIRVFVKGRMAFSSSNDLGEKALDDAVGPGGRFRPDRDGRRGERPSRRQGRDRGRRALRPLDRRHPRWTPRSSWPGRSRSSPSRTRGSRRATGPGTGKGRGRSSWPTPTA